MTIRETILARAAELNLTAHALALREGIGIGRTTLHRYFAGQADLTGEKLGRLLTELGLEVVVKKTSKKL